MTHKTLLGHMNRECHGRKVACQACNVETDMSSYWRHVSSCPFVTFCEPNNSTTGGLIWSNLPLNIKTFYLGFVRYSEDFDVMGRLRNSNLEAQTIPSFLTVKFIEEKKEIKVQVNLFQTKQLHFTQLMNFVEIPSFEIFIRIHSVTDQEPTKAPIIYYLQKKQNTEPFFLINKDLMKNVFDVDSLSKMWFSVEICESLKKAVFPNQTAMLNRTVTVEQSFKPN
jgi:hypothetical protein